MSAVKATNLKLEELPPDVRAALPRGETVAISGAEGKVGETFRGRGADVRLGTVEIAAKRRLKARVARRAQNGQCIAQAGERIELRQSPHHNIPWQASVALQREESMKGGFKDIRIILAPH